MALTPAEIAAVGRMETSRCPRSSIKAHDPAVERRRQGTLRRVREHYTGGLAKAPRRPRRKREPTPDVDYGFLLDGAPTANLEGALRCGRCFRELDELLCPVCSGITAVDRKAYPPLESCGLTELQFRKKKAQDKSRNTFDGNRAVGATEALQTFRAKGTPAVGGVDARTRRARDARRDLAARMFLSKGSVVGGLEAAVEDAKTRGEERSQATTESAATDGSRVVSQIARLYDPERQACEKDFYDVLAKVGVSPLYGRYLREGPRRGDGAYNASSTMRALQYFKESLPRHQRDLRMRRQFAASNAVEAVDLQPLSKEAAPKMLMMLELGMRKQGAAGADAGLAGGLRRDAPRTAEAPAAGGAWAGYAGFAQERAGKDHAYERNRAEKELAEDGDGWRPGAHDAALDSLLDRFALDPLAAPAPGVAFDVAGPAPAARPLVGGRPGTTATPDARAAQYEAAPSPLRPGTTASGRRAETTSPTTWYGDAREGEAKRLVRIKAKAKGGSIRKRRAAHVSKVRAQVRANSFSNQVARQSTKGAGGQFYK